MEGSYFAAHGKLYKYSEQMMEDCCFGDDCGGRNAGCYHGGCIHCALEWMQMRATVLESDYPYEGTLVTNNTCRRELNPPQATARSVTIIDENSVTQIKYGIS